MTLVLGSTGMLAQQIRNGAPADVFFAANESFITELAAENLTLRDTHALYARGRTRGGDAQVETGLRIDSLADLTGARVRRIAIANPQHAPYGLAARQALEAAGLWTALEPKLVFGENVQQAAQFVAQRIRRSGPRRPVGGRHTRLAWTLVDDRFTLRSTRWLSCWRARSSRRGEVVHRLRQRRRRAAVGDAAVRLPAARRIVLSGGGRLDWFPVWLSLRVALLATSVTIVAGVPLAWVLARRRFPGRDLISALLLSPLVLPPTVLGYYLLMLIGSRGVIGRTLAGMEHRARIHVAGRGARCGCRIVSAARSGRRNQDSSRSTAGSSRPPRRSATRS